MRVWVGLAVVVACGCGAAVNGPAGETDGETDDGSQSADEADGDAAQGDEDDADGDGDGTGGEDEGDAETLGEDEGSTGEVEPPPDCEIGTTPASEVIVIGDSYLAITSVVDHIQVSARLNGSLGPQESYRRYDAGGTQMGNGQDPAIDTVIMNGGGNDVLIGSANGCLSNPPPAQACVAAIDVVLEAAEQLLADMAGAGVQHVVYHFYPHLPPGLGATTETVDYAAPLVQAVCEAAPVECHFVDLRPAFEGHPEYITFDGVHPSEEGSVVIADLVWGTMVEHCVAQ
jgi:lysophospholipase L1-like esterase